MEAVIKAFGGRVQIKVDGATMPDLFRSMSQVMEVVGSDQNCGSCNSDNIRPQARKSGDYDFYELHCNNCGAELHMGQKKVGGVLYPKRKDDSGKILPNRGWIKFDKPNAESGDPGPRPSQRSRR